MDHLLAREAVLVRPHRDLGRQALLDHEGVVPVADLEVAFVVGGVGHLRDLVRVHVRVQRVRPDAADDHLDHGADSEVCDGRPSRHRAAVAVHVCVGHALANAIPRNLAGRTPREVQAPGLVRRDALQVHEVARARRGEGRERRRRARALGDAQRHQLDVRRLDARLPRGPLQAPAGALGHDTGGARVAGARAADGHVGARPWHEDDIVDLARDRVEVDTVLRDEHMNAFAVALRVEHKLQRHRRVDHAESVPLARRDAHLRHALAIDEEDVGFHVRLGRVRIGGLQDA
mmetsp:Transcript_23039/g.58806  ORF Transcript_23039/g.58806 Transcript_23039/m.58806 type:complete len:289 (+) Transcript_23039:422-1288(+)